MADPYGRTIEAYSRDGAGAGRTIGANESLLKIGAVAGQSAGQRHRRTDDLADAGNELAAVDVQAVGQHEYAGKVVRIERQTECLAVVPRALRIGNLLPAQAQPRCAETDGGGDDFVIVDVVIVDLSAGAATQNMSGGKHAAQLLVAGAAGQRIAAAEIEHQRRRARIVAQRRPARTLVPDDLLNAHLTAIALLWSTG